MCPEFILPRKVIWRVGSISLQGDYEIALKIGRIKSYFTDEDPEVKRRLSDLQKIILLATGKAGFEPKPSDCEFTVFSSVCTARVETLSHED